jgi:fermentation-respiration switch protein FrsA (DUF1100 family)
MSNRVDIQFISQGTLCRGWYYSPNINTKTPCIIMAHGFGATKELRLDAYAERFANAGYRVLVFDYRHLGSSDGNPRQLLSIKKQHEDWHAALSYARSLDRVDTKRIILWGTSFSGGHVAKITVEDGDIAAVISQVPHLNGPATLHTAGIMQILKLSIAGIRDILHKIFYLKPFYIGIIGEPGELAAMTAPGEAAAMEKLVPPGFKINNKIAARICLSVALYSPGRLARYIKIPWLIQASRKDATTPVYPAEIAASRSLNAELIHYNVGHFAVYVQPDFEKTVTDQLDFLLRHVKP